MTKLTNEQIITGAPKDAMAITIRGHGEGRYDEGTYITESRSICGDVWSKTCSPTRMLDDIRRIVEQDKEILSLRQEVERLRVVLKECDEYLDYNRYTNIGSGSALHRSMKSALNTPKDQDHE